VKNNSRRERCKGLDISSGQVLAAALDTSLATDAVNSGDTSNSVFTVVLT
jgi:hypothetical protein